MTVLSYKNYDFNKKNVIRECIMCLRYEKYS